MKKLIVRFCVLFLCGAVSAVAQIPNAGFETWASGNPVGWLTSNAAPVVTNVTQSAIAHSGSSAVRGNVVSVFGGILAPILLSGADGLGFAFSQRPGAFTGYYQFFPTSGSGDRFFVNVILFKRGLEGTPIAAAAATFSPTVSSYAKFNVPFIYLTSDTPDTCIIDVGIIGPGTGSNALPHQDSYYLLDDLAFGAATSVSSEGGSTPLAFQLVQNYPNPFNPSTAISYEVPTFSHVNLKVFNVLGAEVATLVDGGKEAGRYTVNWNATGLSSGVYLYQLTALAEKGDLLKETRRAILLK